MIARLVTLLVVLCCFSSYSNAQTYIGDNPNALNLGDDSWSAVDLGFDISYFGQTFDKITIYNNGMAKFGNNGQYVQNCCNGYKPTQDQHDYGIFPFWTDLITINNNTTTGLQGVYYLSDNVDTFQMAWIDISEFYNDQTSNTFGVEIKSTSDGALIDFFYEGIDIRNHDVWSGLTGDISEGEVIENFFHQYSTDGVLSGGSELDFSWSQSGYLNCSNPLNDPSCEGYEQAYFEQQCSANALYDPQCPGYEQAYFEQQCSADSLYDPSCPGYEQAYLNQQCSQDSLYDPSCPGYEQAYEDQQCSLDPLWSPKCSGYQMAYEEQQCSLNPQYKPTCIGYRFEDTTMSSSIDTTEYDAFGNIKSEETQIYLEETDEYFFSEEVYEEAVEELVILEEIVEDFDVLEEETEIIEEKEEEVEEDVVVVAETPSEEVSDEGGTTQTRSSGSKVGLSVGLGTANSLVSSLISRSIESGLSNTAQGVGSGGFYGSDTQNMANLAATGGDFGEMTNTNTAEQEINDSFAGISGVGAPIPLTTTENSGNSGVEIEKPKSLAEKMAEKVRKNNLDNQKGIFNKQITMLENIASATDLNKYYDERLKDASDWYGSDQVYSGNRISDSNKSFYRMNSENYGLMKQLIRSQY